LLAIRILAAARAAPGYILVTGATAEERQRLFRALSDPALSPFRVIGTSTEALVVAGEIAAAPALGPALLVIDDAERLSALELREIVEAAGATPNPAAVLLGDPEFPARLQQREFAFLSARITAAFRCEDPDPDVAQPPPAPSAPRRGRALADAQKRRASAPARGPELRSNRRPFEPYVLAGVVIVLALAMAGRVLLQPWPVAPFPAAPAQLAPHAAPPPHGGGSTSRGLRPSARVPGSNETASR
jgi:hypothetical protein